MPARLDPGKYLGVLYFPRFRAWLRPRISGCNNFRTTMNIMRRMQANPSTLPPRPRHALAGALSAGVLALGLLGCPGQAPDPAPGATLQEARRAAAAGDWVLAERLLSEEVAARPEGEEAWVALANLQAQSGRIAPAAEAFVHLADLRPANGVYARQAGSFLEASRRPDEAAVYLQRAFRLRPDDADAAYRYGLHLFHAGKYEEAVQALGRGVDLAPGRPDVVLKLAQAMGRQGQFAAARRVLDAALITRPEAPLLTFQRGLIQVRAGEHEAAVADFRRVLELDPDQHRARYALARALMAVGQEEEGRAQMEQFAAGEEARRHRETARLVQHLARAGGQDDPLERRRRLEDLVLADPGNAEAHRLLARAYADEGDYQQAAASCGRALRLDPADEACARLSREVLRRLGQGNAAQTPAGDGGGDGTP